MSSVIEFNYLSEIDYLNDRFGFVRQVEGPGVLPYLDKGQPAIGTGIRLTDAAFAAFNDLVLDLGVASSEYQNVLDVLANARNGAYSTNDAFREAMNSAAGKVVTFASSADPKIKTFFNWAADYPLPDAGSNYSTSYEKIVDDFLEEYLPSGQSNWSYTRERIALLSLAYNNPVMLGSGLGTALAEDDRAEVWYQIRYGHLDQNNKRRYEEAAIFGLYNDPTNVTFDDAKDVYQMYTKHMLLDPEDTIIDRENLYGPKVNLRDANLDLKAAGFSTSITVDSLSASLQLAANVLNAEYGNGQTFSVFNIVVAGNGTTANLHGYSGIEGNYLIIGGSLGETITGGNGNDALYGEADNDTLIGNEGNDYLNGGTGDDTFIFDTSKDFGFDTLVDAAADSDKLKIDGVVISGEFKATAQGSNQYVSDTYQNIFLTKDPSNNRLLVAVYVDDSKTTLRGIVNIESFNESANNFGLTFEDAALPAEPSQGDAFDTSTDFFSYNPPDYAVGGGTTIVTPAYNIYLPSTSLGVFITLADTSTDEASQAYQLKQWLITEFGDNQPFGQLDRSINYDASTYWPYGWDSGEYENLSAAAAENKYSLRDYWKIVNRPDGSKFLYKTSRSENPIDSKIFEGSNLADVLKGKDWSVQFGNMQAWDDAATNNSFTSVGEDIEDDYWWARDVLFGMAGDDLILGDGGDEEDPELEEGDSDWLVGGRGNDTLFGGGGERDWMFARDIYETQLTYLASTGLAYKADEISGVTLTSSAKALYYNAHVKNPLDNTLTSTLISVEDEDERNYLDGGAGSDVMVGASFNDDLIGGTGNDHIYAGAGQDNISGGDDADVVWGDSSLIYLETANGLKYFQSDYIAPDQVQEGNDYRRAYFYKNDNGSQALRYDADLHDGNAEDREAYNALFNDNIDVGAGDDTVYGEIGGDLINGGAGDDTLMGDRVFQGGEEADTFQKLSARYHGVDIIDGGAGTDLIIGGGKHDVLMGGADDDTIYGDLGYYVYDKPIGGGSFNISTLTDSDVWAGDDYLDGGSGADTLVGEGGKDELIGGEGNDKLYGDWRPGQNVTQLGDSRGNAADILDGGTGSDELYGGAGNDTLTGGKNNDILKGEYGDDTYIIRAGDGQDVIDDYFGSNNVLKLIGTWLVDGRVQMVQTGDSVKLLTSSDGNNFISMDMNTWQVLQDHLQYSDGSTPEFHDVDITPVGSDTDVTRLNAVSGDTFTVHNSTPDQSSIFQLVSNLALENIQVEVSMQGDGAVLTILGETQSENISITLDSWDNFSELMDADSNIANFTIDRSNNLEDDIIIAGRRGNDVLTGGSAAEVIIGNEGDDYIAGGAGDDFLQGGVGDDTYVLGAASGVDTLEDSSGKNTLLLDGHKVYLDLRAEQKADLSDNIEAFVQADEPEYAVELRQVSGSSNLVKMGNGTWRNILLSDGTNTFNLPVEVLGNGEFIYEASADSQTKTRDIGIPTGMNLEDFDVLKTGSDLLIYRKNSSENSGILVYGFFDEQPEGWTWSIHDAGSTIDMGEWVEERLDNQSGLSEVDTAFDAFQKMQPMEIEALLKQKKSIVDFARDEAGGDFHSGFYNGKPIASYTYHLETKSSMVDEDVLIMQESQHTTADPNQSVYSYKVTIPVYREVTIPYHFEQIGPMYPVVDGNNVIIGYNQVGFYVPEQKVSKLLGYRTELRTTVETNSWNIERNAVIQNVQGDDADNTVVSNRGFRGSVNVGEGNNYVNLSLCESGTNDETLHLTTRLSGSGASIRSESGNDVLIGTEADDIISAGAGTNYVNGGAGNDVYYVNMNGDSLTVIDDNEGNISDDDIRDDFGNKIVLTGEIDIDALGYRWIDDPLGRVDDYNQPWKLLQINYGSANVIINANTSILLNDNNYTEFWINEIEFTNGGVKTVLSLTDFLSQISALGATEAVINVPVISDWDDPLTSGTSGNDVLMDAGGICNSHNLAGNEGDDKLYGYAGNDTLEGGAGTDTLHGGSGDDTFIFNLIKTIDAEENITYTSDGNDVILDAHSGDTLRINYTIDDGIEVVDGSAVDWIIDSYIGNDVLVIRFNDGSSDVASITIHGHLGQLVFSGGASFDVVDLYGDSVLTATNEEGETLVGGGGYDTLIGYSGNDVLSGGAGNDTLDGAAGDDILTGGVGKDTYIFSSNFGEDAIMVMDDKDVIEFDFAFSFEYLDCNRNGDDLILYIDDNSLIITGAFAEGAPDFVIKNTASGWMRSFSEISHGLVINGTASSDFLGGHWGNDTLYGASGNDDLYGNEGDDILNGDAGEDYLFGDDGNDILYGGADYDVLYGNEGDDILNGGGGDDDLVGDQGNDTLDGGAGNDYLYGGMGQNVYIFGYGYGSDEVDNFQGLNSIQFTSDVTEGDVSFTRYGDDLLITLAGSDDQLWIDGAFGMYGENALDKLIFTDDSNTILDFADKRDDISTPAATTDDDYLYGTEYNDEIDGLEGNDNISGFIGNDALYGGADNDNLHGGEGNDTLDGGYGDDELYGESGTDTVSYAAASSGVTVDLSVTESQDTGGAGIDTLHDIENIIGSSYNDTLMGDGNANTLDGGDGDDELYGESGTDTVSYAAASSGVTVDLSVTESQDTGGAGIDTLHDIENIIGSSYNDTLIGNAGDNILFGGAGIDTFIFSQGDGEDVISSSDSDDIIQIQADPAGVFVSRDGDDYLIQYKDNSADSIRIVGTSGVNAINFVDSEGNPVLDENDDPVSWTLDSAVGLVADNMVTISAAASPGGSTGDAYFLLDKNWLLNNDSISAADSWDVVDARVLDDSIVGQFYFGEFFGAQVIAFRTQEAGSATLQYFVQRNGSGPIYAQTIAVNMVDAVDGVVTLDGTNGLDFIDAMDADYTVMDGKEGDDYITGGYGFDTVLHRDGDGNDVVYMQEGGAEGDSLILMGASSADDVTFAQNGFQLLIKLNGETITVNDYFHVEWGYGVRRGEFGVIRLFENQTAYDNYLTDPENNAPLAEWTPDDLRDGTQQLVTTDGDDTVINYHISGNDVVDGQGGNDYLSSDDGDDTLTGGTGNDTLMGGSGSDTYRFAVGDGEDAINNYDVNANTDDEDVLEISDVTDYRELWLSFEDVDNNGHDDLVVSFIGNNSDRIVVNDWASDEENQLEKIRVIDSNGTHTLFNTTDSSTDGGLDALVQAMASFGTSPPADGTGWYDGSSLTTEEQTLLTAVNNAWT